MSTPRSPEAIEATRQLSLKVSADGREVERAVDGSPFFWLGDTNWETFHRLSKSEVELLLDNRASKGFNVLMMVVVAEHSGLEYPTRDGFYPFLPAAESTDEVYIPDVSKINEKYFDFVDWVVDEAAKRGLVIALVPTWGRYVNYGYYPSGPRIFDDKNISTLGRYLGERYPFNPFILGGDSNRFWSRYTITTLMDVIGGKQEPSALKELPVEDTGATWEALAASLIEGSKSALQGAAPFMTYHSASCYLPGTVPSTSSHQFPESDWLSMDCIQSGHMDGGGNQGDANLVPSWKASSSYKPIRMMYDQRTRSGHPRPVVELEGHYESTHKGFDYSQPLWTGADIRNGAYQGVFSGGCGYTYGVNSIWQMHNPHSKTHPPIAMPTTATVPWYDELDLEGSFFVSYLAKFVTSLEQFNYRLPDQSIILSDTHEDEGDRLITAMRSRKGLWAVVYTPYGEAVKVDVKKALDGHSTARAQWFNPRNQTRAVILEKDLQRDGDVATFTPPSAGSTDDDYVLLLTKA